MERVLNKFSWRKAVGALLIFSTFSSACTPIEASPTPAPCIPPEEAGNPAIPGDIVNFQWQEVTVTQSQFYRRYTHGSDSYTFTIRIEDGQTVFTAMDAGGNPLKQWASTDNSGGLLLAYPLISENKVFGPVFVYLCGGSSSDILYFDDQFINVPIPSQPQATLYDRFHASIQPAFSLN